MHLKRHDPGCLNDQGIDEADSKCNRKRGLNVCAVEARQYAGKSEKGEGKYSPVQSK